MLLQIALTALILTSLMAGWMLVQQAVRRARGPEGALDEAAGCHGCLLSGHCPAEPGASGRSPGAVGGAEGDDAEGGVPEACPELPSGDGAAGALPETRPAAPVEGDRLRDERLYAYRSRGERGQAERPALSHHPRTPDSRPSA